MRVDDLCFDKYFSKIVKGNSNQSVILHVRKLKTAIKMLNNGTSYL